MLSGVDALSTERRDRRPAGGGISLGLSHRSEEHTSELQSLRHLVCRLLLEKSVVPPLLHSFPTRRSSDLSTTAVRCSSSRRATAAWASRPGLAYLLLQGRAYALRR